jgi:redox-sensitive bicupin YhaK (pirin superfamily)
LQIWIEPKVRGIAPGYEQKTFAEADKRGQLKLVASPDGREQSVTLHADAAIYAGLLNGTEQAELAIDPARKAYVHLVRGQLDVNGETLRTGDALAIAQEARLVLNHGVDAEVLVFDLAS